MKEIVCIDRGEDQPKTVRSFLYNQRLSNILAIFGADTAQGSQDYQALIDYMIGEAPVEPIVIKPTKEEVTKARWESVTGDELQLLYDEGTSSQEIGNMYGVSKVKVIQLANAHGIDRSSQLRRTP